MSRSEPRRVATSILLSLFLRFLIRNRVSPELEYEHLVKRALKIAERGPDRTCCRRASLARARATGAVVMGGEDEEGDESVVRASRVKDEIAVLMDVTPESTRYEMR
jgi:hypothetical protein